MSPPTFGQIAVALCYLTHEQLAHALEVQAREREEQKAHRVIGAICRELGYLSAEEVEKIVRHQELLAQPEE